MKNIFWGFLVLVSLAGIGGYANRYFERVSIEEINQKAQQLPTSAGDSSFKQFDGTQFAENHLWLGEKIAVIYENKLLGGIDNYNQAPNEATVKQSLQFYKGSARVILAFQTWPVIARNTVDPMASEHLKWYLNVIKWTREVLPGSNVGVLISADDFTSDWLQFFQPIIDASDSLYPLFDVGYDDLNRLKSTMQNSVYLAKLQGVPIYPVLWHQGSGGIYQGKILPDTIIQMQCNFVRNNANGVVWWSGSGEPWNGGTWYPAAQECFS